LDGLIPAKKEALIVLYKKCRVHDSCEEELYALRIEPTAADDSNNEVKDQSAPINDASKIEM
jgi:hypothetical protein